MTITSTTRRLEKRQPSRLASVEAASQPREAQVGRSYNAELDTIDTGSYEAPKSRSVTRAAVHTNKGGSYDYP